MRRLFIAALLLIAVGLLLVTPWFNNTFSFFGAEPDAWYMTRDLFDTGRFGVVLGSLQMIGASLFVLGLLMLAYLTGRRRS